jgi:hypothetical protein
MDRRSKASRDQDIRKFKPEDKVEKLNVPVWDSG